jgi:orotidine-5'-phosphate decarboxylase
MVEKFFLALDYKSAGEAIEKGTAAMAVLRDAFGAAFAEKSVGVKINQDLFTGPIDRRYSELFKGIFADMKISHGADTGERIIGNLVQSVPTLEYVTVSAAMGPSILSQYVEASGRLGVKVIAFTAHTKILASEIATMYGQASLDDVIYGLSKGAWKAGCDAVVMEGERLKSDRIRELPIKKLVTGIRIDPSDKGTQSRVTQLDDLAKIRRYVNYVVVSSRYVDRPETLENYVSMLREE